MTALTEWRLAHDLPRRVSAQALRAGRAEFGQTPRVFADFTCPVSADDVVSVLRAGADDWLTFEELLPDPTRCPGGATEFLVELES